MKTLEALKVKNALRLVPETMLPILIPVEVYESIARRQLGQKLHPDKIWLRLQKMLTVAGEMFFSNKLIPTNDYLLQILRD